jgi:osmotically-inducible protein OsmY
MNSIKPVITDPGTDKDLKHYISEELKWDNRIDASGITVLVRDGEVILKGNVSSSHMKALVEESVWMIGGVVRVDNEIKVEPEKSEAVFSDEDIAARIKMIFFADTDLVVSKLDVKVNNACVRLIGSVDSIWKKHYATVRASNVLGVKEVKNEIAVVPVDSREDTVIANDIMKALDRRELVDGDDVEIEVEDGEVALEGEVRNRRAWKSAYDAVRFTEGVKKIEDKMQIQDQI